MVGEGRHSCAGNISWRKVVRLQLHSTNFRVFHFVPFPVIDPLHGLARASPPSLLRRDLGLINGNISYRFLDTGVRVLNFEMGSSNLPLYLHLVAWSSRVLFSSPWKRVSTFPTRRVSLLLCTQIPERTSMIEILEIRVTPIFCFSERGIQSHGQIPFSSIFLHRSGKPWNHGNLGTRKRKEREREEGKRGGEGKKGISSFPPPLSPLSSRTSIQTSEYLVSREYYRL